MASLVVESKMWQILFSSICLASLKLAIGVDVRYGQELIEQLKYSPSLRALLSYSPPTSNNPTSNYEAPVTYNEMNRQPQISSDNCPQLETLERILVLLKKLLNQDDNSYDLKPDKRMQVLQFLKEYFDRLDSHVSAIGDQLKLKELLNRTDIAVLLENDVGISNIKKNHQNHVEANFEFKYNIPNIHNVGCKEALATLIQTVQNAYVQMLNYCNQSGKCQLNANTDQSNIQPYSTHDLNHPVPTPKQNSLNIYDIQSSLKDLIKSNDQVLTHNNYLDPHKQPQSDVPNNQFQASNSNPRVVQILNNQEKNMDAYKNIYFNKEATQSNAQHSDNSKVLNNILSLQHTTPTELQITPPHRYPLKISEIQSPLSNLVMTQNLVDSTQEGSNDYMNLHGYPETYLNSNQFLAAGALNTGVVQTENVLKQEKKVETSNNKYINIFDSKGINENVYGNKEFGGLQFNKPLPLLHYQLADGYYVPINYNDERNQQLAYKNSQFLNDKSASVGTVNQNKYYTKDGIQYIDALTPEQKHKYLNYLSLANANDLNNFVPGNLQPSKLETNFGEIQNENIKVINPTFHPNLNMQLNPYLNSMYQNRLSSLNSQPGAAIQDNFGLNIYTPTNSVNYPKQDMYGNTLFDSHRLASMPNLVKLNSAADNEGVVELTYKLKRPQSINYNPYYYAKFRMPYKDFVSKITDLSRNPDLRSNPLKVHEQLLSISNLADASPDLKSIERDEVSKLILNNGGTLINAKVLGITDSDAGQYLKTIQNLNANLNTNEILNMVQNDKTYKPYWSFNSGIPIFRPEQNPDVAKSLNQNVDSQYNVDVEPRRLLSPVAEYVSKALPIAFLPVKFASQVLSNPGNHHSMMYATLN